MPVEARYIRIVPISWVNNIALQFDVFGCSKNAHLIKGPKTPVTLVTLPSIIVLPPTKTPPHNCDRQE